MKPLIVPEMTFNGHSWSPVMSPFIRSPELSLGDWKSKLHLFSDRNLAEIALNVNQFIGDGTTQQATFC